MHDYMVPPADVSNVDLATVEWKTEFDVTSTLSDMGHDVHFLGVKDDLGVIRQAIDEVKPHIAFNLMEAFHEIGAFDMNVVSYLDLLRLAYTGCNPRGMVLSRDKALSKQLMTYHRIPVPEFTVFRRVAPTPSSSDTSMVESSTSGLSGTSVSRCSRCGRWNSDKCQRVSTASPLIA